MRTTLLAASAILLCSCGPDATIQLDSPKTTQAAPASAPHRFTITRADVFEDELAYHGKRAIYVVVDNETGREFVGISGVGVSETGRHFQTTLISNGKTMTSTQTPVADER